MSRTPHIPITVPANPDKNLEHNSRSIAVRTVTFIFGARNMLFSMDIDDAMIRRGQYSSVWQLARLVTTSLLIPLAIKTNRPVTELSPKFLGAASGATPHGVLATPISAASSKAARTYHHH